MIITVNRAKDLIGTIEMENSLTSRDLILFSLDNVIIEPKQMLGSPEHYAELLKTIPKPDASSIFWKAQRHTEVQLVEPSMKDQIEELTNRDIPTLAFTSRCYYAIKDVTEKQLQTLNVSFSHGPYATTCLSEHNEGRSIILDKGILYANADDDRAECLKMFLEALNNKPSRIIFIAASHTPLEDMRDIVRDLGIDYIGVCYDYLRWKVKDFDMNVADLQREHLEEHGVIFDDKHAKRLLQQRYTKTLYMKDFGQ